MGSRSGRMRSLCVSSTHQVEETASTHLALLILYQTTLVCGFLALEVSSLAGTIWIIPSSHTYFHMLDLTLFQLIYPSRHTFGHADDIMALQVSKWHSECQNGVLSALIPHARLTLFKSISPSANVIMHHLLKR